MVLHQPVRIEKQTKQTEQHTREDIPGLLSNSCSNFVRKSSSTKSGTDATFCTPPPPLSPLLPPARGGAAVTVFLGPGRASPRHVKMHSLNHPRSSRTPFLCDRLATVEHHRKLQTAQQLLQCISGLHPHLLLDPSPARLITIVPSPRPFRLWFLSGCLPPRPLSRR